MTYEFDPTVDAVVILLPEGGSIDGTVGEYHLKQAIAHGKHLVVYLAKGEAMPKYLEEYSDKSVTDNIYEVAKIAREYVEAVPGEPIGINEIDGYSGDWKRL